MNNYKIRKLIKKEFFCCF